MKPTNSPGAVVTVAGAVLIGASGFLMDFLGKWEEGGAGRVLTVYADTLAGGLPTVCKGLTRNVTKTPIVVGEVWSVAKCEREEVAAVLRVQNQLAKCFTRPPKQVVFDMASSHAWNFGPSATCGSAAMTAWNRGQWSLGCQRLARSDTGRPVWSFVKDGKNEDGTPRYKLIQGLANRREDEWKTCAKAIDA